MACIAEPLDFCEIFYKITTINCYTILLGKPCFCCLVIIFHHPITHLGATETLIYINVCMLFGSICSSYQEYTLLQAKISKKLFDEVAKNNIFENIVKSKQLDHILELENRRGRGCKKAFSHRSENGSYW